MKYKDLLENDLVRGVPQRKGSLPSKFFADSSMISLSNLSDTLAWFRTSSFFEPNLKVANWSDKTINYFLERAMPLNDILEGINKLTPNEFIELLNFHNPKNTLPGNFNGLKYRIPNIRELERLNCIGAILTSKIKFRDIPPAIDSISRKVICMGSQEIIRIFPQSGIFFPQTKPEGWSITGNSYIPIEILNWDPNYIDLIIPPNAKSGCISLDWFLTTVNPFKSGSVKDACGRSFGQPSALTNVIPLGSIYNMDELSAEIRVDSAIILNGEGILKEACKDIAISWKIDNPFCYEFRTEDHSDISLSSSSGKNWDNLRLTGSIIDNTEDDTEYTLLIKTKDDKGHICKEKKIKFVVKRQKLIQFIDNSIRCLSTNSNLYGQIILSCPAPSNGVEIDVVASNNSIIENFKITVPNGSDKIIFPIPIKDNCGVVTLTFHALSHVPFTTHNINAVKPDRSISIAGNIFNVTIQHD